jgi:hypothetical protein
LSSREPCRASQNHCPPYAAQNRSASHGE